MLSQVEIGAVCNAPQFTPAKREQEFNIGGGVGIMGQLLLARGRADGDSPPSCQETAGSCWQYSFQ